VFTKFKVLFSLVLIIIIIIKGLFSQ
jgi:hypothetical protein